MILYTLYTYDMIYLQSGLHGHSCQETWIQRNKYRMEFTVNSILNQTSWCSDGKESACSVRDLHSIPRLGRAPGGGHDNPFQYSCLENPMDRETWRTIAHGVTKSQIGPCY